MNSPKGPPDDLEFSTADEQDVDSLVLVHSLAFMESEQMYGSGPPGYQDRLWHLEALKTKGYIKIMDRGETIGGIIVVDRGAREYFLDTLFVHPDQQNKGIGRKAMNHLDQRYPAARKWSLLTPYRDYRNQNFYESLGFCKVGELPITRQGLDPDFRLFQYEKVRPDTLRGDLRVARS